MGAMALHGTQLTEPRSTSRGSGRAAAAWAAGLGGGSWPALAVQPTDGWRELWVFRRSGPSGGWTLTWQGQKGDVTAGTTLRVAMVEALGDRLTFHAAGGFPEGTHADVGIVVVAEPPYAEGVGDSADLRLAPAQLAPIEKVRPLVDTLIVVVLSGRPVLLDGILDQADAVVAAWLPGTENAGTADVLLGAQPFTGTTPYTWPRTAADASRFDKAACEGAVFPFGYGLDASGGLLGPAAC